jgi:hypothetical protein
MNHQAVKCDSPVFNSSLISTDEALTFLLDSAVVVDCKEHVSLDDSLEEYGPAIFIPHQCSRI